MTPSHKAKDETNLPNWFKEKYKVELQPPKNWIDEKTKEIIVEKEHIYWVEMEDVKKLLKDYKNKELQEKYDELKKRKYLQVSTEKAREQAKRQERERCLILVKAFNERIKMFNKEKFKTYSMITTRTCNWNMYIRELEQQIKLNKVDEE